MNKEAKKAFRRLKGMECQLEWSGFGKRNPKFIILPTLLDHHKAVLPNLEPNLKLVNHLNSKREILEYLKIVKPDYVFFTLYSGFPRATYHKELEEITWVITLGRSFFRGEMIRYKRLFSAIYDFFNESGNILRSLTIDELTAKK